MRRHVLLYVSENTVKTHSSRCQVGILFTLVTAGVLSRKRRAEAVAVG